MPIRPCIPALLLIALLVAPAALGAPLFSPDALPPGQADVEAGEKARDAKAYPAALAAFTKAAERDNADALVDLAEMHEMGWGVPKDCAKAAAFYEQAAKLGDPYAKRKVACDLVGREARWKALLAKAEAGDAEAARQAGDAYFFGSPTASQDEKEAAKWYAMAAGKGDAEAMCHLGLMTEYGFGVKRDDKAAMAWYEKAQTAGSAEATYRIGFMHLCGSGVEVDVAQAVTCFRKSAEAGSVLGMRMLAACYREGLEVKKDFEKAEKLQKQAFEKDGATGAGAPHSSYSNFPKGAPPFGKPATAWYTAKAKEGNVDAMHVLAKYSLMHAMPGFDPDCASGIAWMVKAVKARNFCAMYDWGQILSRPVTSYSIGGVLDFRQTHLLWQQCFKLVPPTDPRAEVLALELGFLGFVKMDLPLGEEYACGWLRRVKNFDQLEIFGDLYRHGTYATYRLRPEGLALCVFLARRGDAQAAADMGLAYMNGLEVPRDDARANAWFARAVRLNAHAAGWIGEAFSFGRDVPHDDARAVAFWTLGAQGGDWRSMRLLGRAYWHGEGVPKNPKAAMDCYAKVVAVKPKGFSPPGLLPWTQDQLSLMRYYCGGFDAPLDVAATRKFVWPILQSEATHLEAYAAHRGLGVSRDLALAAKSYDEALNKQYGVEETHLMIAEMAHKGQGMPKDEGRCFDCIRRMAGPGGGLGAHDYAVMVFEGMHGKRDRDTGIAFFLKSAWHGGGQAEDTLQLCFNDDQPETPDKAKARQKLHETAQAGDAEAMYRLGRMHLTGQGVPVDAEQTERWLGRAAAHGHARALCDLASFLTRSVPYTISFGHTRLIHTEIAMAIFQKAAEKGSSRAHFCLGYGHEHGLGTPKDLAKAVACYAKGVQLGDTFAMIAIAELARSGAAGEVDDAKALRWYVAAADKGNLLAMRVLADSYRLGEWLDQDKAQAFAWYEKAAAKGDAEAMFRLGAALRNGHGVEVDDAKATAWYEKAAQLGHAAAMRNLGAACRDGKGMKEDPLGAFAWFELAAREQVTGAEGYRDAVAGRLTEAQLKDAKAKADALGRKIWPDR